MIDVQVKVIGDKAVALHFRNIPPRAALHLEAAIGRITLQLLRRTKEKLSDDVLHVRTGRLRRSITQQVTRTETEVFGTVGTNVEYARAHEFGRSMDERVREHMRTAKQAWGKALKNPQAVLVRAHTRHVEIGRAHV